MFTRVLFAGIALAFAGLGLAGAAVPGLPTVPFLLVAAACARRGWPGLSDRLESHPRWGHALRAWRRNGSVPYRAKWLATGMMAASFAVLAASGLSTVAIAALATLFLLVLCWLWSRPRDPARDPRSWSGETAG